MFTSKFYTDAEKLHTMLEELERKYPTITWSNKTTVVLQLQYATAEAAQSIASFGITAAEFSETLKELQEVWPMYGRNVFIGSDDVGIEIEELTGDASKLASKLYLFTLGHFQRWPRPLRWRIRELARKLAKRYT